MRENDTVIRLKMALNRLLQGKPELTKADGRISISRINKEAGLSQGAIYYYKEFVHEAKQTISNHKQNVSVQHHTEAQPNTPDPLGRLRQSVQDESRLKYKYREQRDDFKASMDELVKENVSLAFRALELEDENRQLSKGKVIVLSGGRDQADD